MKFKTLGFYTIFISFIANFYNLAVANEINESQIFKLPTNTNSLDSSHDALLLLSESAVEEETTAEEENTDQEESFVKKATETEYTLSPLELFPFESLTIETANTLPAGSLLTNVGANIFSTGSEGAGTGLQVYNGSIEYGISDNFQIGADVAVFSDVLSTKFNGQKTDFGFFSLAPNFKYKFVERTYYSLALVGSLEWVKITSESGLFNKGNTSRQENTLAGTIQIPFTYELTDNAQWHLVGGVAFFSDTVNGGEFYGTFFNIGTGLSFKFADRFGLFADVNVPLGPDGNSVSTTGNVGKNAVWSAGFNYLHSPNVALDLSVTNRLGVSPATKLLTFLPDGGQVGVGLNLRYTPDIGQNYRGSFRVNSLTPMDDREKQLLFDSIILSSPTTIRKGMFAFDGDGGFSPGENSANVQVAYGMSDDAQIEFIVQRLADSDRIITNNPTKFGAAAKFNFLNQSQGDPLSIGVRGAFQFSASDDNTVGSFSGGAAFVYSANDAIAFTFNPKAGFFGDNRIVGAGLGINLQPLPGFQLIGEVTPMVSNDPTVWAAGARYMPPSSNVGLGVYSTNAVGTNDIGSIVRQSNSDITVGFNIMFLLGNNK